MLALTNEEKAKELRKDSITSLKWAAFFVLGIIPIAGGAIAYKIFKD